MPDFMQLLQFGSTVAQHLADFFRIGWIPGDVLNCVLDKFIHIP